LAYKVAGNILSELITIDQSFGFDLGLFYRYSSGRRFIFSWRLRLAYSCILVVFIEVTVNRGVPDWGFLGAPRWRSLVNSVAGNTLAELITIGQSLVL